MSTQEVANRLVSLCREGNNDQALEELYAENCTSREMPGMPNEFVEGKEAIAKKSAQWYASVEEIHSVEVGDPIVAENHFSCTMKFDITFKENGRIQTEEICVYAVDAGKITAEQYFYSVPG